MDKLEEIDLKRERRIVKNSLYDCCNWLINYIPQPIKKQQRNL